MKVSLLGSGAWGMGLTSVLQETATHVSVWSIEPPVIEQFKKTSTVPTLPGIVFQDNVFMTDSLQEALDQTDLIVISIPVPHIRSVCHQYQTLLTAAPVLSTSKGIEKETGLLGTEIIQECLGPSVQIAALSGPNFALEIAKKMPSSTSMACSKDLQPLLTKAFDITRFRVMFNDDVIGTQISGALKNVLAILSGITTASSYGMSSLASLLTRGVQDMVTFGHAKGAQPLTILSLAGIGDMILTCLGSLSRNYTFGTHIGQGSTPQEALNIVGTVEGYHTTYALSKLPAFSKMPVVQSVFNILYKGYPVHTTVNQLLADDFPPCLPL